MDCDHHFLAVSYSRTQPEDTEPQNYESAGFLIETSNGLRQNRTPAHVLDQMITDATLRGFEAIWIDQECIRQDGPEDKELYTQGIDAFYSSMWQVVAVLGYNDGSAADETVRDSRQGQATYRTFQQFLSTSATRVRRP